jgi:hypothetical protein
MRAETSGQAPIVDNPPLEEEEIAIALTKTEWFDVLEAIQQNNYVDAGEEISNKIREALKKELGSEVVEDPWKNC